MLSSLILTNLREINNEEYFEFDYRVLVIKVWVGGPKATHHIIDVGRGTPRTKEKRAGG